MRRQSIARPVAALLFTEACSAGWHRPPGELEPRTLPPRQQVQVWQGAHMDRWHGVDITPDSVSGIPFHQGLDCTSCRLSVARAAVDSIRLGNPDTVVDRTILLGIGFLALLAILWPHS